MDTCKYLATMDAPSKNQQRIEMWGLLGIGALLIGIALWMDPLGASPDSGVLDLGHRGTRWLLAALGASLVACGAWVFIKARHTTGHRPHE